MTDEQHEKLTFQMCKNMNNLTDQHDTESLEDIAGLEQVSRPSTIYIRLPVHQFLNLHQTATTTGSEELEGCSGCGWYADA